MPSTYRDFDMSLSTTLPMPISAKNVLTAWVLTTAVTCFHGDLCALRAKL